MTLRSALIGLALVLPAVPALATPHRPLVTAGGRTETIQNGDTVQAPPATTANASINVPCAASVAPTSPQDGDEWCTSAGLFIRVGGVSVGPLGTGGAGAPGGTSGQVQYNNAGSFGGLTVGGDATLNTATGALTLAASGATAGSYSDPNLTVDSKGRVTAITNGSPALTISNFQWTDGAHYYTYPGGALNTVPNASAFTWVNQGSATETASGGELRLTDTTAQPSNTLQWRLRVKTFSGKTTLIAAVVPELMGGGTTGNNPMGGLCLYESSSGKILTLGADYDNALTEGVGVWQFGSTSTFLNIRSRVPSLPSGFAVLYLKFVISGGTITASFSIDGGLNYRQVYSAASVANFTTAPDNWGYCVQSQGGSQATYNLPSSISLLSVAES